MAVNTTLWGDTRAADTNAGSTPIVWKGVRRASFRDDPSLGYIFKPDLYNCPVFASTVSQMGLITLQDTGVTIQGDPTQIGVMKWNGMDADNDAGIITGAGNVGTTFNISSAAPKRLVYEIGIKKESIGNNSMAFFAGLTEEGMATATNTLLGTDTAALADKDLIGFHVTQAAGATVTFVYNKASAGGVTVKIAALQTMVADTWYKFGFDYNPMAPASRRITIYVNGVASSTYVTATNASAATFPDGEELVPTIAAKKGEATESDFFVRLWECAQEIAI